MMKKAHIKFGISFFMLVLLLPVFLTFGPEIRSEKSGDTFLSDPSITAQSVFSFAELCEETEAKDSTESLHHTTFIQFTYSFIDALLQIRTNVNNTHPSFASITNLPLYLAKQVFLI